MNILAIDTAERIISVGLSAEGVYYTEADAGHPCAELLIDMVDSLIRLARIDRESIDLFACLQGPGSWTGLRIGFATVQGLAFALRKPYTLIPALDCVALAHAHFEGVVLPALDAKQQRFFCAAYRNGERFSDYLDAAVETIASLISKDTHVLLTGSGADLLAPQIAACCPRHNFTLDPRRRMGRARDMLALLAANPPRNGTDTQTGLLYLRKSDAELKCP